LTRVLFVCLGNICRSPTAHGVFQKMVSDRGLEHHVEVDSAGTAAWHVGKSPDPRSVSAAAERGYDLSSLRARQAVERDFLEYDYVLAMDCENLSNLKSIRRTGVEPELFLEKFGRAYSEREVPDPYYGGTSGFEHVLDLIEDASAALLDEIERKIAGR